MLITNTLMTDTEIVQQDMQQHGDQGAWDWEADLRFARAVGDSQAVEDLQKCLTSAAPDLFRIAAHRALVRHITRRRIHALRALVRAGKARAFWLGTGPRGVVDFGVNRVRHYALISQDWPRPSLRPPECEQGEHNSE